MVSYIDKRYSFTKGVRPKSYEWAIPVDTVVRDQSKTYDKQFGSIRKFTGMLPPAGNDSQNVVFCRALCDTFNNFRYITANQLYYNESGIYELHSDDHLLKRRLVGHTLWKLYTDIFMENKVFYYLVNIQDRRFGEHVIKQRAHYGYEHNLFALPVKDSVVFFMPRNEGLKYYLGELPFYYEGVLAGLIPTNIQKGDKK